VSESTANAFANKYVIGVDYGTLSGRALLVRVSDGAEIATSVYEYPHAVIEDLLPTSSTKLPPDWALQVPADYVDVLKNTVPAVLKESGISPDSVIGITTDFTACTVCQLNQMAHLSANFLNSLKIRTPL